MDDMIVGEVYISYEMPSVSEDGAEAAEAVRHRIETPMGTIGKRFEHVISVNAERGYRLRDWKFTSTAPIMMVGSVGSSQICETIIAVFEKVDK